MKGEIKIIIHATEDIDKILSSVKRMLKVDVTKNKISRQDLSGHYGNSIIYLSIKIDDYDIHNIFSRIKKYMDSDELLWLISNIDEYIDRSALYLRIDKQELCRGNVKLVEKDPIKIIIKNINKNIVRQWLSSDE